MNNLYILQMAGNEEEQSKEEYLKNIISKGKIKKNKEIDIFNDEGIMIIEETIPYIEKIYRNPNRLIVNEEEIVKVELAKKVTVESIKHLSKHTNLIKSIDESGEVEPSKVLNINKEETYNTYENKLIYSLIENMKIYVKEKKTYLEQMLLENKYIKDKKIEYTSNTNAGGKDIELNLNMKTVLDSRGIKAKVKIALSKIENIEKRIRILTEYEVYNLFYKRKTTPITSPIKKTNLILKNVNFQYAIRLWDYLQEHLLSEEVKGESTENIEQNVMLKKMLDEISMLYFIAVEKDGEEQEEEEINKAKRKLLDTTLKFLDLPNKEVEKVVYRNKKSKLNNSDIENEIRNIFSKYFSEYLKEIQK